MTKEKVINRELTKDEATEIMKKAYTPRGYTMLVEMLPVKISCLYHGKAIDYDTGMVEGGTILLPPEVVQQAKDRETVGQIIGRVIKKGPDCYTRMGFAPEEHWCKEGDLIRVSQYAGDSLPTPNRIETHLKIVNDKDCMGVYDEDILKQFNLLDNRIEELGDK